MELDQLFIVIKNNLFITSTAFLFYYMNTDNYNIFLFLYIQSYSTDKIMLSLKVPVYKD